MHGARVLLPADRGWSASGPPNVWAVTSVEEIADTARMVVSPDEPFDGHSQKDMEADHWASLAAVLRRQGVEADALELGRLPHDVVLGEQLLARIGHQPGDGVSSPDGAARVCVRRRTRIVARCVFSAGGASTSGRSLDEVEVAHTELMVLELLAEHRA